MAAKMYKREGYNLQVNIINLKRMKKTRGPLGQW